MMRFHTVDDVKAFIDCNAALLPHIWVQRPPRGGLVTWFKCQHCPVSTRTLRASVSAPIEHPNAYLPTDSTRRMANQWDLWKKGADRG